MEDKYNNGKASDLPIVSEMIRFDNDSFQIHKPKEEGQKVVKVVKTNKQKYLKSLIARR